jgi:hypothetical protein
MHRRSDSVPSDLREVATSPPIPDPRPIPEPIPDPTPQPIEPSPTPSPYPEPPIARAGVGTSAQAGYRLW